MAGTLYVVATPIGNLEDLTFRAIRILREAAVIAAEDTRVTRKLLTHYDIHTPLTAYHAHTGPHKIEALVARLEAGDDMALVTDAGTPGISDPGGALIRAALESGVVVVPIPGPSALTTALCAAGLDTGRVTFLGFLPRKAGDQRRYLEGLRGLPHTLVFYEAPDRLVDTLETMAKTLGNRQAVVARELTKKFEEFVRGPLEEVAGRFRETGVRGECVVLVAGRGEDEPEETAETATPEAQLASRLAEGMSVRDASRAVAEATGRPRKELYALAMALQARGSGEE